MNCEVTMRWLGAYLDGELEPTRRLDLEAHLAACFTCKTAAEEAVNFEPWVRINMPVYKTPLELKARIQASLRREFRSSSNGSLILAAVACAVAMPVLGLPLAWAWIAVSDRERQGLIEEALLDHSRPILVNRLLYVTSSNAASHTPGIFVE